MALADSLLNRARRSLQNPSVVTDEDCEIAAHESSDICAGRVVNETTRLDIAMYRLKLRLKVAISEEDEANYDRALAVLRQSAYESGAISTTATSFAKVGQRTNQWVC